jgi:beta-N-acetylhexosaminidase
VAVAPVQYRALAISSAFGAWVQGLASGGTRVVVVSLGTPYLLEAFPAVPAFLLAWDSRDPAEGAAAAALLGAAPVGGRLPVSLPPFHRLGEGTTLQPR